MSTELSVVQRASVALGAAEHEKALRELAGRSAGITAITNEDSYKELHSARMVLKNSRINIERLGKAARDDATKFSKAVIQEEKRLIDIILPEESRLLRIQSDHDIAAEKAERERVGRIQAEIDRIKGLPMRLVTKPAADITTALAFLREGVLAPDFYQEFLEAATLARNGAEAALVAMERDAIAHEAEAARLKAEREDLDRRQAEQRQREAEEEGRRREAREREEAELAERRKALKDEEDRQALARREIEEAQAKARREQEDRDRAVRLEQEARDLAVRQEADRIALAAAEHERATQAAKDSEERAQRLETEAHADGRELLERFRAAYGERKEFARIVKAIDAYFVKVPQ